MKSIAMDFIPNALKRSCYDCDYCQSPSLVSWWCVNVKAKEYRGTMIPDTGNCNFWKPIRCWNELSVWEKLFSFVYSKLRKKNEKTKLS